MIRNRSKPGAIFYILISDLIRFRDKLIENDMVFISRLISFKIIKEIWFYILDPKDIFYIEISFGADDPYYLILSHFFRDFLIFFE